MNQLASFARGTHTQAWVYDALGNWDSVTTDGSGQTRTHNKQNEVTSVSGATSPTFDANGNMTRDETGKQFVYDAWDRLKVVKDAGGATLKTYGYDGLGRRVSEAAGGTTTDLYYSAGWLVLEERVGGVAKAQNVWSPVYVDALVLRDRDADGSTGNGLEERLYAQQDANWNVTALVGLVAGSWGVVERYAYDPFGAVTVYSPTYSVLSASGFASTVLFQGFRQDPVTGFYHARIRDYSATLGRPIQVDPIRFGSGDVNYYRWEGNGPVTRLDPSGLDWWDYVTAAGKGLWEGAKNIGRGARDTAIEIGQSGRDIGNTAISAGSWVTDWAFDTGIYEYDLHSQTFSGYDQAIKSGTGDSYTLNMMANGASLGVKPLIEGIIDYAETGDATNASRTAGGVAAGNLAGAAGLKVAPKVMPTFGRCVRGTNAPRPNNPSLFQNQFPHEATPPHTATVRPSTFLRQRGAQWFDYVVLEDGTLVVGRQGVAGQGHANLAQGQPVRAAGQVQVSGGQIVQIDNASGHYLPSGANARQAAINAFQNERFQVPNSVYVEKVWNPQTRLWEPVNGN